MGLVSHQDFKVINLWEVEVGLVFERNLTTLLPFVPILKGGQNQAILNQAVTLLRADEDLAELEPLLAFFASFVLDMETIQRIMRWDMTILRESPWYEQILEEGIQKGLEEGRREAHKEMLLHTLNRRFENVPSALIAHINQLSTEDLLQVIDIALEASTLQTVEQFLATFRKDSGEDENKHARET